MAYKRSILGVALTCLAGAGMAAPGTPDAAPMVAARQAAFRMSGAVVGAMKTAVDRGDDVAGQAGAANALASWGRALPGLFPAGSMAPASRAAPAIWSDRAGFEKAAADYADAATKLGVVAKAGDKVAFATQFSALRASCTACHDHYRQPDEPRH